jgi:hypothetical protein
MILIITNKADYTADFAIQEMNRLKVPFVRFNTEDFPTRASLEWQIGDSIRSGSLNLPNQRVPLEGIKSVWYRRPVPPVPFEEVTDSGLRDFSVRENRACLEGLLRTLDCFWMSDPDMIRRAEHKMYQLKVASQLGFEIPATLVTNSSNEARAFYDRFSGDIVVKPVSDGRLREDGRAKLLYTTPLGAGDVESLGQVKYSACQFQKYIPKLVEIRATVVGDRVFGVEIHSQDHPQTRHDWRRPEVRMVRHKIHALPPSLGSLSQRLVASLKLAFGALDFILTPDGHYVFLEINPNGQWAWLEEITGLPIARTLVEVLQGQQVETFSVA